MKYHLVLLCLAVIFSLFLVNAVYSVDLSAKYDNPTSKSVVFTIKEKLQLRCNSSDDVDTFRWEKNGVDVATVSELKGRYSVKNSSSGVYEFSINKANENDIGNYSCVAINKTQNREARAEIKVTAHVHVKVPTNINVVEGEKLKIECQTVGRPELTWTYIPEGAPIENRTVLNAKDRDDRVSFKKDSKDIPNAIIEIINIGPEDRGNYTCIGTSTSGTKSAQASCILRVKGRYAALWPFLGICVEVFVLCLIIFIYEKKRNKTELEESDTDQSPDQKNTPDHGKESNLRHRQ